MKSLYIASTHGSGGKTTSSVGLCLALRRRGLHAGYFKPVGTLGAADGDVLLDEDAAFVAELLELDDAPADLCPVVLDEDALQDVLTGSEVDAMSRVEQAFARISAGKDVVVCEGLGEIWQGRFLRTSGTEVVRRLDLRTVLVAKFAGARLLDDICYVKDALKTSFLGVIFNMVPETPPGRGARRVRRLPRQERRGQLRRSLASNNRLSAVSVDEIVAALGGTYVCGEQYGGRPGGDVHDRRHEPRARACATSSSRRTRSSSSAATAPRSSWPRWTRPLWPWCSPATMCPAPRCSSRAEEARRRRWSRSRATRSRPPTACAACSAACACSERGKIDLIDGSSTSVSTSIA